MLALLRMCSSDASNSLLAFFLIIIFAKYFWPSLRGFVLSGRVYTHSWRCFPVLFMADNHNILILICSYRYPCICDPDGLSVNQVSLLCSDLRASDSVLVSAGFVVGQCGLYQTFAMLLVAYFIISMTVLSVCAISTNGALDAGGAYCILCLLATTCGGLDTVT